MPRNVEIKATLQNAEEILKIAATLENSSGQPEAFAQIDTFFNSREGRMKLREFPDGRKPAMLFQYTRENVTKPKLSAYLASEVKDPESMKALLDVTNGTLGILKKVRNLVLIGRTRLHVDVVEGLGNFVELEVVLNDDETEETGIKVAEQLMNDLGIPKTALLSNSYFDMLLALQAGDA